jgi:hypothetical protein
MPTQVDRSVDDFAARIKSLSTVEDALVFTPFALFADVKTPDEAMTRFETLDPQQRMQLLAMFQRVDEQ